MSKRRGNTEWKELKKEHWGQNVIVDTWEWGYIDFSPQGMKEVFSGEKLTYEEYLDAQMAIGRDIRGWFFLCHHEVPLGFAGQIEKITPKNICFKRIYVSGMYMDGECFDGKEDHVWMSIEKFEDYQIDDCLEFFAETYRYVKTSNGKQIDFGLRNPSGIKKVDFYKLPSDDDLLRQSVDQIICETCMFRDHCCGGMCMANKEWLERLKEIDEPGSVRVHREWDYLFIMRDFSEHLKAMVYSLLSAQRPWAAVVKHLDEIDGIFFGYDAERILEQLDTYFVEHIRAIKCGNRSINGQMRYLPDNVATLRSIEAEYGSLDAFVTSAPAHEIVKVLTNYKSKYKLRNVGIDGAKPDVHLRRLSKESGFSMAAIDNIIWSFCSEQYGEICGASPKCTECPVKSYCHKK